MLGVSSSKILNLCFRFSRCLRQRLVFHRRIFTSKVSLREVCHVIMKYGFVVSPYPIVTSAEVHYRLVGQDSIGEIMDIVRGGADII